ncbi:MAG: 4-(cytidine 5'-diphospho)-2-C-methyl-D-erythritol kinase [Actinomycetota bacterium]|nr:4-(cytidine 5'-diphospho)-2-C-methyl-D-erythritol kinase [Actinomycetota bacterium]
MTGAVIHEEAYAKLNLVLHVGPPRADGMHPLCSIFASVDLADAVEVEVADSGEDSVDCPGVNGANLAEEALIAFRRRVPSLPPLRVVIDKRIPVAAGLGGGSADAAAVLRTANRISEQPLSADALRELAAVLGSDVPSQIEPRHALVQGVGEIVEPVELAPLGVVLAPQHEGLSTADVYAQLDRMRGWREPLDPRPLREFARTPDSGALDNDLQPAAMALRPGLAQVLDVLRETGALGTLVSGSGPTCFGVFADRDQADRAARKVEGAIATELRQV